MLFQPHVIFFFISVACAVRPEGDANGAMNKGDPNTRTAAVLQSGHLQKVAAPAAADPPAAHSNVAPTVDLATEEKAAPPASMIEEHASQEEKSEGRNHEDTIWCRNYCAMCPPLTPEALKKLNATRKDEISKQRQGGDINSRHNKEGTRQYVYIHRSKSFIGKLLTPFNVIGNVATLGMMSRASHALYGEEKAHCPNTKLVWQVDGYGGVEFSAQLDYGLIFSNHNGPLEYLKFHSELWTDRAPGVSSGWKFWRSHEQNESRAELRNEVYTEIQEAILDMCTKAGPGLDRDSYVSLDSESIEFKKMWGYGQLKKCLQGKPFNN